MPDNKEIKKNELVFSQMQAKNEKLRTSQMIDGVPDTNAYKQQDQSIIETSDTKASKN